MSSVIQKLLESLRAAVTGDERRLWAVTCARVLGLDGIAASLDGELVWFSDATGARLEDVQFILGQGPGLLFQDETTVEVPEVSRLLASQWPQFAAEAQELGIAALFVWPVRLGAAQVGTMTGYRRTPGPLTPQQSAEGWLVADVLAQHVLNHWPAVNGSGGWGDGPGHAGSVDLHRAEVHQATGILSVQLGVPLPEALDRLRARAYAAGQSLTDAAHAVIAELPP
ncbi:ANTAR domain-containing protein [Streptomyces tauricus]